MQTLSQFCAAANLKSQALSLPLKITQTWQDTFCVDNTLGKCFESWTAQPRPVLRPQGAAKAALPVTKERVLCVPSTDRSVSTRHAPSLQHKQHSPSRC